MRSRAHAHPDGRYTATARWLHWLVAALILANLVLGLTMVGMPGITPTKLRYFNWHKWVGVTVLALAVLMFAVPLSGYFYSLAAGFPVVYLGVLPLPVLIAPDPQLKQWLVLLHHLLAWLLLTLLVAHVAAALKHRLVDHDDVLQRMLPRWRRG